jgi:hypothetical protein
MVRATKQLVLCTICVFLDVIEGFLANCRCEIAIYYSRSFYTGLSPCIKLPNELKFLDSTIKFTESLKLSDLVRIPETCHFTVNISRLGCQLAVSYDIDVRAVTLVQICHVAKT